MSFDGHFGRSGVAKHGAIPTLYPGVNPLQLERFLTDQEYYRIKAFPNILVLPLFSRKSDRDQRCFGAGLARLMIRNLMLLRDVSIHGPEDTPAAPYESIANLRQAQSLAGHITGVAGFSGDGYSLQVELHRADRPVQSARIDGSDFKAFVFDSSVAIAGLLESKLTDVIQQAWKVAQPRDAQSLVQLGQIQLGFTPENTAERAQAARELLDVDPDLSVATWDIDEEVPGPQQDYLAALERDPFNAQLCFQTFLTIWKSKGPQPEALQFCRRAIELSPGHGKAHMCAPHAAQRPVDMLNHSELGYRLLPGNPFAVNNYVLALDRAKAPASKRIELAREGIASDPRAPGNYLRLVELCSGIGDYETALATAERLQRLYEPTMDSRALYCLRQNPRMAELIDSGQVNPAAENRQRIAKLKERLSMMSTGRQSAAGSQVRCAYCHQYVEKAAYAAHVAEHRKLRPDGQQKEYLTLPVEEREPGSLAGVPQWYMHHTCGKTTGMPEDIVRSYLKNPYLYNDRTFCSGCRAHVPMRECAWRETGQNVQTYMDKLRAAKPNLRPATSPPPLPPVAPPLVAGPLVAGQIACVCGKPLPGNSSYCRRCGRPVRPPGGAPPMSRRPGSNFGRVAIVVALLLLGVIMVSTSIFFRSVRSGVVSTIASTPTRVGRPALAKRPTLQTLGLKKSKLIGSTTGGGSFESFSKTASPVVGFRFKLNQWGRKTIVSFLQPIYREDNLLPTDDTVMAREGYVVSGIRVNGHVSAVQVIFTREQGGQLVAGDTYDSQWLGEAVEADTNVLDGNGRPLMGLYGRRGMNIDGIGVLYQEE